MSTDTRDDDIRAGLHDLAESIELTGTEDPVARVHARTQRSGRRSTVARALAIAAALALIVGVVAVLATRDDDDAPDVATDPTPTTVDTPQIDGPPGLAVDAPVVLRFGSAWVRPGTDVAAQLDNRSSDRVLYGPMLHVSRWDGTDWVKIADVSGTDATFQEWHDPDTIVLDYTATVVEPFAPSPHLSLGLPEDLEPGFYRVELYEGQRAPEGGDPVPFPIEGRFEVIAPDAYAYESVQFGPLPIERVVLPDDLLVLSDGRVAIRFTTSCNQPAQEIGFTNNGDAVLVEVRVGQFMVIDCVGEPSDWSVVLDPPVDPAGKQVFAADDLGNRRAAVAAEVIDEVVFYESDAGDGLAREPALVLGTVGGSHDVIAPSVFSPAPACTTVKSVGNLELEGTAGTFTLVTVVGAPGADCVPAPGWVSLQPFISAPDEAPLAMPNVIGLDVDEAADLLAELGFVVEVVVEGGGDVGGRVSAQDPAPASSVPSGSTVVLTAAPG